MQHPEPLLLCQFVLLTTNEAGRPTCVFRANSLNLSLRWGIPVPVSTENSYPALIFDKYVAPLEVYLPHLLATQHHPADAPPRAILPTPDTLHLFSTSDPSAALRDYNPRSRGGTSGSFSYQTSLTSLRDRTACALVMRLLSKGRSGIEAVSDAALRIGMSAPLLQRVVLEREGLTVMPTDRPRKTMRGEGLPRLSDSHEYRHMFKEVQNAVQTVRTRKVSDRGSFSIHDLHVTGEPGGYPTRCPVLGVEFAWGEPAGVSLFSPKVGRIDPRGNYTPDNVLLMSRLAKRILEGTADVKKLAALLRSYSDAPLLMDNLRQWLADKPLHPANDYIASVRRRMTTPDRRRK